MINKIILKIYHFFGCRLYEEHITDITINISTEYDEDGIYEIHSNKCESIEAKLIMEDILTNLYSQLNKDKKLEKRCRNVKQVCVTYYQSKDHRGGSIVTFIPYEDSILYNPFDKPVMSALERERKINKLLA